MKESHDFLLDEWDDDILDHLIIVEENAISSTAKPPSINPSSQPQPQPQQPLPSLQDDGGFSPPPELSQRPTHFLDSDKDLEIERLKVNNN